MGKKFLGLAIIILGAILLAGFVYFLFIGNFSLTDILTKISGDADTASQTNELSSGSGEADESTETVKKIIVPEKQPSVESGESSSQDLEEEKDRDSLMRTAASFAERFGSYSNQSNFSNIIDLKIFMSSNMQIWADNYIREQKKKEGSDNIYFGITTKAIAQEIQYYDDHIGQAEILVRTRRREAVNSITNVSQVFNQDIIISFQREGGSWKVDNAFWQDK